jgi:DHA1 family multidrug resistance protein-like MFS transporter
MLISPLWGSIADRYGKKPMVVRAMAGGAITVFLMGFVRTAEELIILRILQGLLSGVISASSALVASIIPKDKSGYSMGILQIGVWTGVSMGPLLGGIFADVFGFRSTFVITGILLSISAIAVFLGVQESGIEFSSREKRSITMFADWKVIFSKSALSASLFMRFLSSAANTMLLPVIPLFMILLVQDKTKLSTLTGAVTGIASFAGIIGAVVMSKLSDRIGHYKVVLFASVAAGVCFIPLGLVNTFWELMLLSFFGGIFVGALTPSLSALLAKNSDSGTEGSIYGLDNSIVAAGRVIAPLAGSYIASQFSYSLSFVATGIIFFLIAVIAGKTFATTKKTEKFQSINPSMNE